MAYEAYGPDNALNELSGREPLKNVGRITYQVALRYFPKGRRTMRNEAG